MLTYFEAHNFKSIKSLRLEMRPFMVLVGPNGAGKTNVVRALELFGRVLERGTTDPVRELGYDRLIRRGRRAAGGLAFTARVQAPGLIKKGKARSMPPVTIEASLKLASSPHSDEVEVRHEALTLQRGKERLIIALTGDELRVDAGNDEGLWDIIDGMVSFLSLKFKSSKEAGSFLSKKLKDRLSIEKEPERRLLRLLNWQRWSWLRPIRDSARVSRLRLEASFLQEDSSFEGLRGLGDRGFGPRGEGLAIAIDALRGGGNAPKPAFIRVLNALQHAYPRIEDIRPYRTRSGRVGLLFRERGMSDELEQGDVSDGVLHALALLVAIEGGLGSKGILAIEEPENAVHPWAIREIIDLAQQEPGRRILLTTHSVTVVNAVRDPRSLFLVENDDSEGTTVTPALKREAALEAVLRESGQRLGEVWLDGSLGGVPTPRI